MNVKKIATKLSIPISILIVGISTSTVLAAFTQGEGPTNFLNSPVEQTNQVETILINVVKWTYTVFFIMATIFILVAAYNFLRGGTNPKAIETAKNQLKYAVIAIVIALVASGASLLIKNFLGPSESDNGNQTLPAPLPLPPVNFGP
jgi:hypothetical protein